MEFKFNGVIWDTEADKALCEAENGVFKTDDESIIKKLLALGYKEESKEEIKEEEIKPKKTKGVK